MFLDLNNTKALLLSPRPRKLYKQKKDGIAWFFPSKPSDKERRLQTRRTHTRGTQSSSGGFDAQPESCM